MELCFLLHLSAIVGRPLLPVSFLYRHGLRYGLSLAVVRILAANCVLNREDVLASGLPEFVVGTTAMQRTRIGIHGVSNTVRCLRWNYPNISVFVKLRSGCDLQPFLFSNVHCAPCLNQATKAQ